VLAVCLLTGLVNLDAELALLVCLDAGLVGLGLVARACPAEPVAFLVVFAFSIA